MAENFKVSLQSVIDEFKLEAIYVHKDANELMIDENDVNRPGLQLMGFYEYFNPERIQIIGRWNLHIFQLSTRRPDVSVFSFSLPSVYLLS